MSADHAARARRFRSRPQSRRLVSSARTTDPDPSSHTRTRAPEVTPASSDRCSLRLAGYEDVNAWQLAREAAMRVNVGRGGSIVPPLQAPQPSTWARSRSSLARGAKADHRALGVINR